MAKKLRIEMVLYTLCLEGTAIGICALGKEALKKDAEATIRAAFFETWRFGGGDLRQLVGRALMARSPTEEEAMRGMMRPAPPANRLWFSPEGAKRWGRLD
jgi:hypothetical protein